MSGAECPSPHDFLLQSADKPHWQEASLREAAAFQKSDCSRRPLPDN